MREQDRIPSLAMHSTARRAAETWRQMAPELGIEIPSVADESLYLASPQHLFVTITATPEPHGSVLIVAHNPGLQELALVLVRDGAPEDTARLRGDYPAGALTEIRFAVDRWSDVRPETGRLERITFPRGAPGES